VTSFVFIFICNGASGNYVSFSFAFQIMTIPPIGPRTLIVFVCCVGTSDVILMVSRNVGLSHMS
jgi:hypothetical protein